MREAAALEGGEGSEAQIWLMMSPQGREVAQPGSNLKKLERGMVVVTWMRSGT